MLKLCFIFLFEFLFILSVFSQVNVKLFDNSDSNFTYKQTAIDKEIVWTPQKDSVVTKNIPI